MDSKKKRKIKKAMIEQPNFLIDTFAYPHQLTSVYNMENRELNLAVTTGERTSEIKIGILGDLPGFGKTLSVVILIARDRMKFREGPKILKELVYATSFGTSYTKKFVNGLNTTLVVMNQSLLGHWQKHFRLIDQEVCPLNWETVTSKKDVERINPNETKVVLCISSMYNKLLNRFPSNRYEWKRFVFDEVASTNISGMQPIRAKFMWFITSTYHQIGDMYRNKRTNFLREIFIGMHPDMFEDILIRNSDDYVRSSFALDAPIIITHKCMQPGFMSVIQDFIPTSVAEMISADNIKGAIASLGGTTAKDNVVQLVCQKLAESLKTAVKHMRETEGKSEHAMWVANAKSALVKYKALKERMQTQLKSGTCPICQDPLKKAVIVPCCNQSFCGGCLIGWLSGNKTCPMCRTEVSMNNLVYVCEKDEEVECPEKVEKDKDEPKTKIQTLIDIVKGGEKCLIFSSHEETFVLIQQQLAKERIPTAIIQGTVERREKLLAEYKRGTQLNVILLNSKYNGAGLDLPETKKIIIYHDMSEVTQLIGRGLRMGRKSVLEVHYLE